MIKQNFRGEFARVLLGTRRCAHPTTVRFYFSSNEQERQKRDREDEEKRDRNFGIGQIVAWGFWTTVIVGPIIVLKCKEPY